MTALAVTALSVVVPSAVSAPTLTIADVPDISVMVRVPQSDVRAPMREAASTPEKSVTKAVESRSPAIDGGPLPGVIRELHVMYAGHVAREEPTNASPCPKASTCTSNSLRPGRWPTDGSGRAVIPFSYNDEGRRPARAPEHSIEPTINRSMREWTRWNSNIVFDDAGPSDATFGADGPDGTCDDGTNVVTWEKFSPDVIGAALLCFDRSGKVVLDADLALNSTQHWEEVDEVPDSRHSHDLQSILTHELGHWLSLADLYSGDAARQTMSGSTAYGQIGKRTLALGDIVGVQKAYPCATGDSCPRTGVVDD